MEGPLATTDVRRAWEGLRARLAPQPEHRLARARFGTEAPQDIDPRLHDLLPANPRQAAVLIGLVESFEGPGILLTVRAEHLRQHAGQIAFPGGAVDAGDADATAAALREAHEEVGLDPASATVLGYLPDQYVLTGFRITPVVAALPASFVPVPQAAEVQACFVLPFATLLDPAAQRTGLREVAGIQLTTRDVHFGDHRIWGATAGMLLTLRAMALS